MMPKPAIRIGLILLATLAPSCLVVAQEMDVPATLPQTTAASEPADGTPPWMIREAQRPDRPQQIADAMTFSPQEVAALTDITDRTETLGTDRLLLLMLSHVAKIKPLSPEQFNWLEPASPRAMQEAPEAFRGAAVRMDVRVFTAKKLSPGSGMDYSQYWPKDAVLWKLVCTSPSMTVRSNGKIVQGRPLIILSTVDPVSILGKPRDTSADGQEMSFGKAGVPTELAGMFFKLCRARSDDGELLDYPVLLAWQFRPSAQAAQGGSDWTTAAMLFAMALVLGYFCWRYLRSRIARSKAHWQEQLDRMSARAQSDEDFSHERVDPALLQAAEAYFKEHPEARPRHTAPRTNLGASEPAASASADDAQVDPALREAAEQFMKEHPEDDGKRPS